MMLNAVFVIYDSIIVKSPQSGGADIAALLQWNDSTMARSRKRTLLPPTSISIAMSHLLCISYWQVLHRLCAVLS